MDASGLDKLDILSLEQLYRYHDDQARDLRLRLKRRKDDQERRRENRQRLDAATQAADHAITLLRAGFDYDAAAAAARDRFDVPPMQLQALINRRLKERSREAREIRRAVVVRFAMARKSNDEIADRLQIHRNTVSADLKTAHKLL